jgi:hypothetical protein
MAAVDILRAPAESSVSLALDCICGISTSLIFFSNIDSKVRYTLFNFQMRNTVFFTILQSNESTFRPQN